MRQLYEQALTDLQAVVLAQRIVNDAQQPYTPLSAKLKPLHPFCGTCGWRKGGVDSWDGKRCRCGQSALPMILDGRLAQ